jgi:chorismate mutase
MHLPRGDHILLDLVRLFEKRAHVFDEAARSRGR